MDFLNFEKKIKITFKNKNLLKQSLTHKSFDSDFNNEKLEFLGDRILGFIIAKKLLELYPGDKEGVLDKKLSALVNKKICFEVISKFEITKFIKTNTSDKKNFKVENKIVSDTCEAVIGAVFLDQGIKIAEKFVLFLWQNKIDKSTHTKIDSKTKLQEYSLKKYKSLPLYKLVKITGPKHKPLFQVQVKIKSSNKFTGTGNSKKEAEQNAATNILKQLNNS